jgi:hypothetical protein
MPLRPLDPADAAKIAGDQRYVFFARLRITLHAESEELRQYSFRVLDGVVHFDLTERYMAEFEQGVRDVRTGTGDYCIPPKDFTREGRLLGRLDRESEELWFWPCFGHISVVP